MKRRQFILAENKWHIKTFRSRRREWMLRELCEMCHADGQKAALEAAAETANVQAAFVGLDGSRNNLSDEECRGQPSFQQINGSNSNLTIDDSLANISQLQLGSNTKTWLDFGSEEYNCVGGRQSLPLLIRAPGSTPTTDDSDLALYFDVEIGSASSKRQRDFCFSLREAECFVDSNSNDNECSGLHFTFKEGEFQVVYITWSPSYQGGLRESIRVKTTFNETEEIVAEDEIIAVGCAGKETNVGVDGVNNDDVKVGNASHDNLAQSPPGHQIHCKDEVLLDDHLEISRVDKEKSKHDLNLNQSEVGITDASRISDAEDPSTDHVKNQSSESHITTTESELKTTTTTTLNHQQLHISIKDKMAKIRAQRDTMTSTPRDHRGRPLRQTHPSNRSSLSNGAKLWRHNRELRISPQNHADVHSDQANYLSLEENRNVEILNDEKLANSQPVHESSAGELVEHVDVTASKILMTDNQEEKIHQDKYVVDTESELSESGRQVVDMPVENNAANVTIITDSSKVESEEEEAKSNEQSEDNSTPDEFESCHSDSSSYSDLRDDVADHQFDSPATRNMLHTMVNVSVEVDEAKLTACEVVAGDEAKVFNENTPSSLADEISEMKDYLTSPRDQVALPNEDLKVDDSVVVGDTPDVQASSEKSTDRPKVFRFEEDSIDDELLASPDALFVSKSYENTTNELNEMMDKDQLVAVAKRSNTPLKDLHDQINFIINTQKSASPAKKKADLTPEPDHIVPLKINGTPLVLPSSTSRHTFPSNKPKTPSSIIRSSLYKDIHQSDRPNKESARLSARALYFYSKSPRNADLKLSNCSETTSVNKLNNDNPREGECVGDFDEIKTKIAKITSSRSDAEKEETINKGSSGISFSPENSNQPKASVIKTIHASEVESKEKVVSETNSNKQRKAYPRQEARSHENSYRSRIQTVSTSRMSATGNELTPKGSASTEEQAHSKPTAKSSARALYFFKSPSSETLSSSGTKTRERGHRASEPLPKTGLPSKDTPSPSAPRPKSLLLTSPPPVLSTREQMAIDKHIHSMNKKNARKSIV